MKRKNLLQLRDSFLIEMQSAAESGSASESSPESATPDSKVTYLERHTSFFIQQIRHLREPSSSLPPDVKIVCKHGEPVFAHKFVLHFVSQFFQVIILNSSWPFFTAVHKTGEVLWVKGCFTDSSVIRMWIFLFSMPWSLTPVL